MIGELKRRAGITGRGGAHSIRHKFATDSVMNDCDSLMLQILLGHSTLTMTKRYVAMVPNSKAIEAHRKFSPVDNMKLR
jgi:integrase/recombinase XerC